MYKPDSLLENKAHKILWNLKNKIPARRSDLLLKEIIKKKYFTSSGFFCFSGPQ